MSGEDTRQGRGRKCDQYCQDKSGKGFDRTFSNYTYQPIKKVLVPCDFNAVETLSKVNRLYASAQWQDVELTVLNVDSKQGHLNPDEKFRTAENSLHNYLKNFPHRIYYVPDKNVIDGILNFTQKNQVELMIALPGKYSFSIN